MRLTHPLPDYDLHVEHDADPELTEAAADGDGEEVVRLRDDIWPGVVGFENPFPMAEEDRERYPEGTDRRALVDGEVSVSPLSVDHSDEEHAALVEVVDAYNTKRAE
jgi:5'-nucleotidase